MFNVSALQVPLIAFAIVLLAEGIRINIYAQDRSSRGGGITDFAGDDINPLTQLGRLLIQRN